MRENIMETKAIMACVLEKPIGSDKEGSVIHVDEDDAKALIQAGICREAKEEDMSPPDEDEDDDKDEDLLDNMEPAEGDKPAVQDQVRKRALSNDELVAKAVDKVTERLARTKQAVNIPTNRISGSDFLRTGGYKSLGDCALGFIRKSQGDRQASKQWGRWQDQVNTKVTAMTYGGTHIGSDLVPQEWSDYLAKLAFNNVPDLFGLSRRFEMHSMVENIPAWVQQSATSGITAAVTSENTAITATTGVSANIQLSLQMFAALISVSDALNRFNAYHLQNVIEQVVPERIRYYLNDGYINGTNSQVNLVNNASTVTVIAQTPGQINYNDVTEMEAALFDEYADEGSTVWLTNKSTLPQLYSISFPNRTASTQIPAFSPGGFNEMLGAKPKGTLLGRPIYTLENVPGLGNRGSLILVNLKSIAVGMTGLIADRTNALYFNLAVDSLRFLFYADSASLVTVPYTRKDGSLASNIVILSAGSTSSS